MMQSLLNSLIIISVALHYALAQERPIPYVAWAMNNFTETTLIPEYNNDKRFISDYSKLGSSEQVFKAGPAGKALFVDHKVIKLIKNVGSADCIKNIDKCDSGLSLTFWLTVQEWHDVDHQVFFRTTNSLRQTPGVYFAREDKETELLIYFRKPNGQYAQARVNNTYVFNVWSHFGIVWKKASNTLKVYINGTALLNDEYVTAPENGTESTTGAILTDMTVGSSIGPTFLLDEFNIFYRVLTPEEAMFMYNGMFRSSTTATIATTQRQATTTTRAPTTTTNTTAAATHVKITSTVGTTYKSNDTPTSTAVTERIVTTYESSTAAGTGWEVRYILLATLLPFLLLCVWLCFVFAFCFIRKRKRRQQPPTEMQTYRPVIGDVDSAHVDSDAGETDQFITNEAS